MGTKDRLGRLRALREQRLEIAAARKRSPKFMGAIRRCFATEDGKHVLSFLKDLCGWDQPGVGGNPDIGADVLLGTYYAEVRREVYAELRALVPREILKEVEFYTDRQDGEEEKT